MIWGYCETAIFWGVVSYTTLLMLPYTKTKYVNDRFGLVLALASYDTQLPKQILFLLVFVRTLLI